MAPTRSHAGGPTRRSRAARLGGPALVAVLLAALPAAALAAANWGFGPSGKSSATVTWQPDDGQKVTAVVLTLPVKAKSARTRLGRRCTIPSSHPRRVRCAIVPAAAYGYIDVRTRVHLPRGRPLRFSARPAGKKYFVRQQDIPSGNGCS
jgi:hypothetical protein